MNAKIYLNFILLQVQKSRVLITKDSNSMFDSKCQTKLPGVVEWNLIRLAYKELVAKYGSYVFISFS